MGSRVILGCGHCNGKAAVERGRLIHNCAHCHPEEAESSRRAQDSRRRTYAFVSRHPSLSCRASRSKRSAAPAQSKHPYLTTNHGDRFSGNCDDRHPFENSLTRSYRLWRGRDPSTAFSLRIRAGKTSLRMTGIRKIHWSSAVDDDCFASLRHAKIYAAIIIRLCSGRNIQTC